MASEEDEKELELKDLILQTLESNGILSKLKAQIRANVFVALDESDKKSDTKLITVDNPFIKKLLSTKEGRLTVSLVREFLESCNLEYTIAVFDPEINSDNGYDTRDKLLKNFNLSETDETKANPLLYNLLKTNSFDNNSKQKKTSQNENLGELPKELSTNLIEESKKKFEFYDKDKNGLIDKNELKDLFIDMHPNFNKNILERFVTDEFRSTDRNMSNGIDFNEFKSLYKRWFLLCRSVVTREPIEPSHYSDKSDKSDLSDLSKSNKSKSKLKDPYTFTTGKSKKSNEIADLSDELSSSSNSISEKITKREDLTPRSNSDKSTKSNNLLDLINTGNNTKLTNITKNDEKLHSPVDDIFNFTQKGSTIKEATKNTNNTNSNNAKSSLKDAPNLFAKSTSNIGNLKDIDKKIKGLGFDYDDENYDDDFTSGTTPRTHSGIADKRRLKPRNQASEDEIDENISYADESSKFDEFTVDKSITSNQANNEADYIEDLSI